MPASTRQLMAALRIAVWIAALRHSLALIRLGWRNTRVLRWFAAEELKSKWHTSLWLPIRCYVNLFGTAVIPQPPDPREATRLRRLRGRLNKAYAGYQPAADPLTSPRARSLQTSVVRNVFGSLFHIRLNPTDRLALAGYGSAGMAARDFLNYARDFGWSIAPALTLQLFLADADTRHAKTSSRRRILHTLRVLARLHRRAGPFHCLYAARYGAERLLSAAYWAMQDRRENKMRCVTARGARCCEGAVAAAPLRRMALLEQRSLLAVFAHEMQWRAIDELLELRAQMPTNPGTSRRFEIALAALEDNTRSALPGQLREENEDAGKLAEPGRYLDQ